MLISLIFLYFVYYIIKNAMKNDHDEAERAHDKHMAEQGYDIKSRMEWDGTVVKDYIKKK